MPYLKSWTPKKPQLIATFISIIVVICGVLSILYAWELPPFFRGVVSTDDAYIQAKTTLLSPRVSGYVTDIYVHDFTSVKAGEPILQIDRRIFVQKVNEAEANLQSVQASLDTYDQNYRLREAVVNEKKAIIDADKATLENAKSQNNRVSKLVKKGSLSAREYEDTQTALKKAQYALAESEAQYQKAIEELQAYKISKAALQADVKRAEALLELAQINLEYSLIKAPVDGTLGQIGARIGQAVTQGTPLTFLIPNLKWVEANIKETKMQDVHIGQKVTFSVDALGGAVLQGRVERISPATGSEFSSIRVNNATGNFIKIIQRIPVRIEIDPNDSHFKDLKAGMSVIATIHTQKD
ncbi:HlyD family secretion protein [Helicobacter cappadocius]|uniref:HlyD family secretion protein n=1 Tax=Helicobacter cappadocius TaxID=3063998 RepID=A0AA90SS04_9HELI|nr:MULTISPECIES: HlyD family secretion protein [unclassified Helicobacter]MDO7252517.1 HlyD family secretion protein [Helicobacter sp. faydin-H75]MDP2538384.1 HlyD family secretion protein [Helicobacter sp. faydin-H76]